MEFQTLPISSIGAMKIESSDLMLFATHRSESTTVTIDRSLPRQQRSHPLAQDSVTLSGLSGRSDDWLDELDPKDRLAILILEHLLGRKIQLMCRRGGSAAASSSPAPIVQRTQIHSEAETTTFRAQGTVQTTDGRSISFAAGLTMSRSFESAATTTQSSAATDPLILNLNSSPAQLTGAKVSFDLNSDGKAETISFVDAGSGFLAIDRNQDGRVTDGSELFGPETGNGFSELAANDADGNGWIDEADPIFSKLQIWTQDGLYSLQEKGIGAISVNSVETPFAIKDNANSLQGNVRATGVFLFENGGAGSVEQVDLVEG